MKPIERLRAKRLMKPIGPLRAMENMKPRLGMRASVQLKPKVAMRAKLIVKPSVTMRNLSKTRSLCPINQLALVLAVDQEEALVQTSYEVTPDAVLSASHGKRRQPGSMTANGAIQGIGDIVATGERSGKGNYHMIHCAKCARKRA